MRFERFEIRVAERQLRVDGQPVPLGSRAFDLLVALAERRDRLVSKDELLDLVWPGLVVEENNLQVQVSALRRLLGPQVITTVPARGYRFTALPHAGAGTGTGATPPGAGAARAEPGHALASSTWSAPPKPATTRRARLLLADDNKVNRLLLARSLELQGHHVTSVEHGAAVLERLRAEPFDLLLLDLEMPELDGFAVLERLRAEAGLRDLPVVITSSVEGVDAVARCIELGADDFLHKPVHPLLLKARVGASLEKKRLRDRQRELIERSGSKDPSAGAADELALPGQRLAATVLFTRLANFEVLAAALPPEESIELLGMWTTLMFDAVGSQQGAVNRVAGPTLMALFGAPLPAADAQAAPVAAVRAALDMAEMVDILNAERTAAGKPALDLGVGIASGSVVAGTAGAPGRPAYACVGAPVDHAARLMAEAGGAAGRPILIDEGTQAALQGRMATDAVPAAARATPPVGGSGPAGRVFAVRSK
ncbi:MAG: response regulator [Rubrivivax sp.]|nr:response regulator [Rubrivivax sp.]